LGRGTTRREKNINGIETFINLDTLRCNYNQITSLDVSNNTSLKRIVLRDNPNLKEVCVWITPFPPEGVRMDKTDSPKVNFTTECGK